jgi:hypothetical protein
VQFKTSFFTRKRLVATATFIFAAYVCLWIGVLISNRLENNHEKQIIESRQQKFDNLKPEEKAVINAQNYLKSSKGSIKIDQRLFIDYLQRKFDLDGALGVTQTPIQIVENPATYPQEINFLARIVYPDRIVTVPPRNVVDGPTLTNIFSANCDHTPLPKNFWLTMNQNYSAGGYYLAHNALAFAFMKDNGCAIPASDAGLPEKTINGMVKLADDPNTNQDLRYEAIAFLCLSGRTDLIKSSWISEVISQQKEDGSWVDEQYPKDSDHTTVLALWALLEYSHPNTPYEPLIHRPSKQ